MIPLFTEPLDELTKEHVRQLIDEEMPEGQTVEFKEALAARRGRPDTWLEGREVGEHARNDILKEVVAFANSDGGNLVLGIVESATHPKRARKINALPRCHELADRLRLMARDCIEPQLPSLEATGVDTRRGNNGVILLRVPRSRLGPHRLSPTRRCYVRRADRTEEMTMREIQDASVQLARGGRAIEKRLEERRAIYLDRTIETVSGNAGEEMYEFGVRVTVLPVGGSVSIIRVYEAQSLKHLLQTIECQRDGSKVPCSLPDHGSLRRTRLRPTLRGGHRWYDNKGILFEQAVFGDGLSEFIHKYRDLKKPIYSGDVLAMAANALLVADAVRKSAGVPGAELILDVEMRGAVQRHGSKIECGFRLRDIEEDQSLWAKPNRPIRFPMQSISSTDQFGNALHRLLNDLRNTCGRPHVNEFEVDLSAYGQS